MKRALLATFTRDAVVDLLRPLRPPAASVFCFHRFADPDLGNKGHDLTALRRNLGFLRRHRLHVVPLAELMTTLEGGEQPRQVLRIEIEEQGWRREHALSRAKRQS